MLEVSRRSVVVLGAGIGGAIAVGALAAPAAPDAARAAPLPGFTAAPSAGLPLRSHFAGHEGETFLAVSDAASVALTLTSVHDVQPAVGSDDENRFTLIFAVQGTATPAQAVYEITHPEVPAATLFAAPVLAREQRHLQVLVNRGQ